MRLFLFVLFCLSFYGCKKKEIVISQENGFKFETEKIDGLKHGIEKVYYPSGELQAIRHYKKDTLNGLSSYFDKSGKLSKEFTYKGGLKEGLYRLYYPNGNIAEAGNFVSNYIHGEMSQFFETDSGKVRTERYALDFESNINEVQYFKRYDINGEVVETIESLKILLPNEVLKNQRQYEINFEFSDEIKSYPYDSAIIVLGDYANDFKGTSDTLEFKNGKAILPIEFKQTGIELIRGKWIVYKKTQDADSIYEYTTIGFFEKPIKVN